MRATPLILTAFLAIPALAEDFWTTREPDEWSGQEIKRMVTDSPWAREISVRVNGSSGVLAPAGLEPPPAAKVVVRWDSAAPVREACAKGGMERYLFSCASKLLYLSGLGKKFDELANQFYIVTLGNYPNTLSAKDREAPQHSEAANAALERLSERLRRTTFLKRKGKEPLSPARIVTLPAGQSLLVITFFSRDAALTAAEKEASFELTDATLEVKTRFNLTKMTYRGKLDL